MAYVIGKKVVKDTTEFNDYAYGIILPIAKGPTGYFEQAYTSFEQASSNLLNLLLTNKGERIMQPEFGTGLQALLFEQMTDDLEEKLTDTITDNVNFWLPYINIDEIDVEMTDELKDNNRANIKINFTVGSDITTREITFTIRG
jgi:phage baseplate assembly protein W